MAGTLKDIEREAMALPTCERAELAERLLASLEPEEDGDIQETWLREAERRYQEYRGGRMGAKPAEQVFDEVRKTLR